MGRIEKQNSNNSFHPWTVIMPLRSVGRRNVGRNYQKKRVAISLCKWKVVWEAFFGIPFTCLISCKWLAISAYMIWDHILHFTVHMHKPPCFTGGR